MKKNRLYYLLIFIMLFPALLPADFGVADNAEVRLYNDAFSGELSLAKDDYRSYGFGGGVASEDCFSADLFYYGFTDRKNNLRSDELILRASYSFLYGSQLLQIRFTPYAGAAITGNTGGQWVQNLVHSIFGLKHVNFNYDETGTAGGFAADALFGLSFDLSSRFKLSGTHFLEPVLSLDADYGFFSGLTMDGSVFLNLKNDSSDCFSVFAGWTDSFTDYYGNTIDLAVSMEQGPRAGWSVQTGVLGYSGFIYSESGFSNGYISLFFPIGENSGRRHEVTDFMLDYSLDILCYEKQIRILFPIELQAESDDLFSVAFLPVIEYMYGDAIDDFSSTERQIRLIQLAAGAELSFRPLFTGVPAEIFAGCSIGFRNEKFWILPDTVEENAGLMLHPQIGIRSSAVSIFADSGIFNRNVKYGLSAAYGFQYIPFGDLHVKHQHHLSIGINLHCDF